MLCLTEAQTISKVYFYTLAFCDATVGIDSAFYFMYVSEITAMGACTHNNRVLALSYIRMYNCVYVKLKHYVE